MSMPLSSLGFKNAMLVLSVGALVGLATYGCKKNDQDAATGGYQLGQTAGGAGGAPVGAAGAPPAAGGAAPVGAAGAPPAAAGAPGTLPPPPPGPIAQKLDASAAGAIRPLLDQAAKEQTQPGAKAIGETLVGNFGTGQTLESQILLQPNKCYTVVATALPPVTEVNIQLALVTPIPGMAPILAVDQDSGPNAVLGKKATCYKWMFGSIPASAKFVIQVAGGTGLVAAQAYEK